MDLSIYSQYWSVILGGLWTTAYICFLALGLGLGFGLAAAFGQAVNLAPVRWFVRGYVELFRGTPILIQLFLLYYVGPDFGVMLSAETVGVVGLGLYNGAYFAEIFRAGLESIPKGQIEAGECLGMTRWQILRRLLVPQMAVLVIPPAVNQAIILIKDSAVLSIITVPELTKEIGKIVNLTFSIVEPYVALGIFYWLLVELVARGGKILERRMLRHMR